MKKLLILTLAILMLLALCSCTKSKSTVNGVKLSEYSIVYSDEDADYSKRAAEYIAAEILSRTGLELPVIEDNESPAKYEIVVGETSREISDRLNADTEGTEFAILAEDKQIALEGDYFIIAAAAYYFINTYVPENNFDAEVPKEVKIHTPIIKKANNFILLIGDGMGVNQTLLYDECEDVSEYSDGEDGFYGYLLPYMGYSRTDSLSGVTDSAAGGTALSSGIKTLNSHVGKDKDGVDVQSIVELAGSRGMATAVMSTESQTGATPSSFSAHTDDRDKNSEILDDQTALTKQYGTVIDCGYDYYTERYMGVIERHITDTLAKMDENDKGFFLMYEEAHIDKHSHKNDMDKTFLALIRFNQAIGRFMEYAFYNPDTMIIITADHETGDLRRNGDGVLEYNSEEHSSADVPVFVWGLDGGVFNGKTFENIQIAHTVAELMGVPNFGDQSEHKSLLSKE